MARHGSTPPFRRLTGETLPGSVEEAGDLRLGGVNEWVMIRGETAANPA